MKIGAWVLGGLIVIIAAGAFLLTRGGSQGNPSPVAGPASGGAAPIKAAAMTKFTLAAVDWEPGSFEVSAAAALTFDNRNLFLVKDVTVRCRYFAQDGTELGESSKTLERPFPPAQKVAVERLDMGYTNPRARSGRCDISDLRL